MRTALTAGRLSCAFAIVTAALAGCDSTAQQNETLTKENEALKAQLADRNSALERADQERQDAVARAADAEAKLQSAQAGQPSATPPAADASAFAGIDGVTATAKGNEIHVSIEGDVLFDSGRDELKSASKRSLDKIASVIKAQHPNADIRVAGFTDTDPIKFSKFKSNYHLGFERAFAVREYLITKGLESKKVSLSSYGPDVPQGTKAKSRRVEVIVIGS